MSPPDRGGDILVLPRLSVRLSVRHTVVSSLELENRSRYFHESS